MRATEPRRARATPSISSGTARRAERETQMLLNAYRRALDRGDIVLRDGVAQRDLIDAVTAGDLARIHNQLVHNNYCGLPQSKVKLVAPARASSPTPAPTARPTAVPTA